MTRQFDEAHGSEIEFNGERLQAVEPTSFEQFLEAVKMKDKMVIAAASLSGGETTKPIYSLLAEQERFIRQYIEDLGYFDNSNLAANINYLCRKYGVRIGELESYIGISAGYISRTTGKNSPKKISIDVVWKLARLFNVTVQDLIGSRLEDIKGNTALLLQFLDKLIAQTESGEHAWQIGGGDLYPLNERLAATKLFREDRKRYGYYPDHLNKRQNWFLSDDIVICPEIFYEEGEDLVIIPFTDAGGKLRQYDIILLDECTNPDMQKFYTIDKLLYTIDDPYQRLNQKVETLYSVIRDMEFDAKMPSDIRTMVKSYLKQND